MIITLLAIASIATQPLTTTNLGRLTFQTGACSSMGWKADLSEANRMGERLGRSLPGMSDAEIAANITHGVTLANRDYRAIQDAVTDEAGFRTMMAAQLKECDAIAATYPALLQRTPETSQKWEELMNMGVEYFSKP